LLQAEKTTAADKVRNEAAAKLTKDFCKAFE
jgi:hypothetical protein